jgi:YD repeat-containing protein
MDSNLATSNDELGHTTTLNYDNGDHVGNLLSLTDPDSRYRYTYDLAGRLTIVDNTRTPNSAIVLLSYGYDAVNNLTSVTNTINGQQAGNTVYTYRCLKP